MRGTHQFSLDWLLHPIAVHSFFDNYWQQQPLLVKREQPAYFADLPGLDAVDELITATIPGPMRSDHDGRIVISDRNGVSSERSIRLGNNGIPDIQEIYRQYHNGYSIVVNQVHRRSAEVSLLCRALEIALHHPIGANLYLTPRDGQAFPPHVDTHDVFILQLHGVKEWHVSSPSNHLPLADARPGLVSLHDFRKFSLGPGDILYLPRGFPHEAVTADSSTLHLTIGVHVYRWIDLVVEALRVLADEQLELRTSLPPGFLDNAVDSARVTKLAKLLEMALTDNSLVDRAKVRLGTKLLGGGKAAGRGHFRSLDAISGLTAESVVYRSPGIYCRVRSTFAEASIEFASNYVSGPLFLEPALKFIAEHQRFAIFELPDELTTEDKLVIVTRLISEGLLSCINPSHIGEVNVD